MGEYEGRRGVPVNEDGNKYKFPFAVSLMVRLHMSDNSLDIIKNIKIIDLKTIKTIPLLILISKLSSQRFTENNPDHFFSPFYRESIIKFTARLSKQPGLLIVALICTFSCPWCTFSAQDKSPCRRNKIYLNLKLRRPEFVYSVSSIRVSE